MKKPVSGYYVTEEQLERLREYKSKYLKNNLIEYIRQTQFLLSDKHYEIVIKELKHRIVSYKGIIGNQVKCNKKLVMILRLYRNHIKSMMPDCLQGITHSKRNTKSVYEKLLNRCKVVLKQDNIDERMVLEKQEQ